MRRAKASIGRKDYVSGKDSVLWCKTGIYNCREMEVARKVLEKLFERMKEKRYFCRIDKGKLMAYIVRYLSNTDNVTTITEKHLRSKALAGQQDEDVDASRRSEEGFDVGKLLTT